MIVRKKVKTLSLAIMAMNLLASANSHATINYLGMGSLGGGSTDMRDLSGLSGALENGVPQNLLGGFGSGIAYTGVDNRFVVISDRGPNAVPYNSAGTILLHLSTAFMKLI